MLQLQLKPHVNVHKNNSYQFSEQVWLREYYRLISGWYSSADALSQSEREKKDAFIVQTVL